MRRSYQLLFFLLGTIAVVGCSYDRIQGWHFDPFDMIDAFLESESELDRDELFYQRAEEPFDFQAE